MLGLAVVALVWLRLALRLKLKRRPPGIVPAVPARQHCLATTMHLALYAFMIIMPLLGWLLLSAESKPVPFFGLELPAMVGADAALADSLETLHETIVAAGHYLVGLHAVAALFHHYFLHDNTLLRMLPQLRRRPT